MASIRRSSRETSSPFSPPCQEAERAREDRPHHWYPKSRIRRRVLEVAREVLPQRSLRLRRRCLLDAGGHSGIQARLLCVELQCLLRYEGAQVHQPGKNLEGDQVGADLS